MSSYSFQYIIFSNCGDSRAVLSRGGRPVLVTQDHKPSNPPERERIQAAGGSVMMQRVNGSLAVSRALGDFEYKNVDGKGPTEQLVSPEPGEEGATMTFRATKDFRPRPGRKLVIANSGLLHKFPFLRWRGEDA